MLNHTKGNLLDLAEEGKFDVVVQGCNCFAAMGGGIAREIKRRFPYTAAADIHYHNMMRACGSRYNMLGTYSASGEYSTVDPKVAFTIVNAYTQYTTSTKEDVFEYDAFKLVLKKILVEFGSQRIGLPYIGMGLAGGDSTRIIPMIEEFAEKVALKGGTVTLVEFA